MTQMDDRMGQITAVASNNSAKEAPAKKPSPEADAINARGDEIFGTPDPAVAAPTVANPAGIAPAVGSPDQEAKGEGSNTTTTTTTTTTTMPVTTTTIPNRDSDVVSTDQEASGTSSATTPTKPVVSDPAVTTPVTPVVPIPAPKVERTWMQIGDQGEQVGELQMKLNEAFRNEIEQGKMLPLKVDGIYGKGTEGRVREYQSTFRKADGVDQATGVRTIGTNLKVDGLYGVNTTASLDQVLSQGPDKMRVAGAEIAATSEIQQTQILEEEIAVQSLTKEEAIRAADEIKSAMKFSLKTGATDEAGLVGALEKYSANLPEVEAAFDEKYSDGKSDKTMRAQINKELGAKSDVYYLNRANALLDGDTEKAAALKGAQLLEKGYRSQGGLNEEVIASAVAGTNQDQRFAMLGAFKEVETARGREGDYFKAIESDKKASPASIARVEEMLVTGKVAQAKPEQKTQPVVDIEPPLPTEATAPIAKPEVIAEQAKAVEPAVATRIAPTSERALELAGDIEAIDKAINPGITGLGTNEKALFDVLRKYVGNPTAQAELKQGFKDTFGKDLEPRLLKEFGKGELYGIKIVENAFHGGSVARHDALWGASQLARGKDSIGGVNINPIMGAVAGTTPMQRNAMLAAYNEIETMRGKEGDFYKAVRAEGGVATEREMIALMRDGTLSMSDRLYYSVASGRFQEFGHIVDGASYEELKNLQATIGREHGISDFPTYAEKQLEGIDAINLNTRNRIRKLRGQSTAYGQPSFTWSFNK